MEETMRERNCFTEVEAHVRSQERTEDKEGNHLGQGNCESYQNTQHQTSRAMEKEMRQCGNAAKKKAKKATGADLRIIIQEQGYRCAACAIDLSASPQDAEIDHRIPVSDGGDESIGNLQWLCRDCNRAKGGMSMRQFVAMCKRIAHNNLRVLGN